MNGKLTLLLILLTAGVANAQTWCPPGATWTYQWDGWGAEYRQEYSYIGDTLHEGRSAHKVQVTLDGFGPGGIPIVDTWTEYTANEDGVIWTWTTLGASGMDSWDTLYWFGAQVGERWWPPGHPEDCPPKGMLEVTAAGTTVVDGLPLQTLSLVTIDENGQAITNPMQLVERIGTTPRVPFIFSCGGVIDYFFPHFICYSDEDVQLPESSGMCHLTLNTDHSEETMPKVSLHPNPGTDHLTLLLPPGPHRITLMDATGRSLMVQHTTGPQSLINTSALSPGMYLVRVDNRPGIRWVKE